MNDETTPADYCQGCGFPAADCECAWHAAAATAYRLSRPPTTSDDLTDAEFVQQYGLIGPRGEVRVPPGASATTTSDDPCECSEDDGPCEVHAVIHAQREGASCRTADELALVLIDDLLAIHAATGGLFGAELSAWGADVVAQCDALLDGSMDHRWLDDADLAESLRDVAWQCESGSGLWITHEDGYVIAQVIGGPLFD